jgi:hypothetical protein
LKFPTNSGCSNSPTKPARAPRRHDVLKILASDSILYGTHKVPSHVLPV